MRQVTALGSAASRQPTLCFPSVQTSPDFNRQKGSSRSRIFGEVSSLGKAAFFTTGDTLSFLQDRALILWRVGFLRVKVDFWQVPSVGEREGIGRVVAVDRCRFRRLVGDGNLVVILRTRQRDPGDRKS